MVARVACVSALAFFVLASYAVARSASESLFLSVYGSRALPFAWIAVALTAGLVVAAYKTAVATVDLVRVFQFAVVGSAVLLAVLLTAVSRAVPGATFVLYVWKDVYVVVLVEAIWALANTALSLSTARWVNGLFCAAGQLGDLSANLGLGFLSRRWGTHFALGAVFPLLAAALLVATFGAAHLRASHARQAPTAATTPRTGLLQLLRASPYLTLMLALIGIVQIAVTLVDYSFSATMELAYPVTDVRTAELSHIYGVISVLSFALQLLSGPILRFAGATATLLTIPALLGIGLSTYAVLPSVTTIAIAKIASKAFDYSVFRAAKETLYLPLPYAEKTAGKAVVDVMAYRVAKAGASLLLLGLSVIGAAGAIVPMTFTTLGIWEGITLLITRRHAGLVKEPQEATQPGSAEAA